MVSNAREYCHPAAEPAGMDTAAAETDNAAAMWSLGRRNAKLCSTTAISKSCKNAKTHRLSKQNSE